MLLIDKPAGPTSHDVVGAVRRVLGQRRVGHAGTLDPGASGLLVVLVGRATRLMQFVGLLPKRYIGTVRFGCETTTDDAAGEPTLRDDSWGERTEDDITHALRVVRARATQVPPPVSAKKVDGERAYVRARRGEAVELAPVPVVIHQLRRRDAGAWDGELPIEVECSSGTYIRSIARDIGRTLLSRAHLLSLRRTGIGPWDVRDAIALDDALAVTAPPALRPMAEAVAHLLRLDVNEDLGRKFRFGQKWPAEPGATGFAAVYESGALLGVAEVKDAMVCPAVGLAS